ncbi:MAG: M28 family peptidase, partial [Promethearchaeota archaeon]
MEAGTKNQLCYSKCTNITNYDNFSKSSRWCKADNSSGYDIIDDHIAFVDNCIPSADLIINFWNNPNWPHHHTINDNLSYISNHSLSVTGKTVEQFIYNNYFANLSDNYSGSYPWDEDFNLQEIKMISFIITIIALLGVVVVLISFFKNHN